MNIFAKSLVAGVLALGASGAYAIGLPASGSSDLILLVQNTAVANSWYALDTGISINSEFNGPYTSGATLSTSLSGINTTINESSTLQSFLATPGGTFGWMIVAGQSSTGTISTASPQRPAGILKALYTSGLPGSNQSLTNIVGVINGVTNDLNTGLSGLIGGTEVSGVALTDVTTTVQKNNTVVGDVLNSLGNTASSLYAFTGNGINGPGQSYVLGDVKLLANGNLVFGTGGSTPVPLPAAVWLLGSGLMGLMGVSRRRVGVA